MEFSKVRCKKGSKNGASQQTFGRSPIFEIVQENIIFRQQQSSLNQNVSRYHVTIQQDHTVFLPD